MFECKLQFPYVTVWCKAALVTVNPRKPHLQLKGSEEALKYFKEYVKDKEFTATLYDRHPDSLRSIPVYRLTGGVFSKDGVAHFLRLEELI